MRNIFILNPKAGKRSCVKQLTRQIHDCFAHSGEPYEIYTTECKGDGTRIARSFAGLGEEMRIFACGGDGSAFDVLNGIAGAEHVSMGVIPCGTGNDFLKYFDGISHFACVEDQLAGAECRLDVIKAGPYYCMNQASMGMDAQVCSHKDKFSRLPFVNGQLAYVLSLFYCFFSAIQNRFLVQIDDQPAAWQNYLFAIAANGRYYGGGFQSAPLALANDGLLDCVTVESVSRFRILSLLRKYSKGEHLGYSFCRYCKGKTMTVQAEKETAVNLDGEVIRTNHITFEIIPSFVRFIVPHGSSYPAAEQKSELPKEAVTAAIK